MSYEEFHRRAHEEYCRLLKVEIDEKTVLHFNIGEIYLDSHGIRHLVNDLLTFDPGSPNDGPYCDWYRPATTYSVKDGKLVSYILKPEGYVEAYLKEDYAPLVELLPSGYNDQISLMQEGGLDFDATISCLSKLDEIADKIRYDSLYIPRVDL